ncbi:uncharacterized protein G2W53_027098 [Senna tora]|uniref:Uncharacterized protein n=1 Tax=Senna tora TaxID=362788 RepID=A0A834WI28_9FABA|nr:uncharacterized protein G2W53_027098 [Senna tora]
MAIHVVVHQRFGRAQVPQRPRRSTSASIEDLAARKLDCLETSWDVSLCPRLQFDPAYAREILHRKKFDRDSLNFDGRRSTWSTAGRPTRIALKLLGRLLCVIGIILSQHMHRRRLTAIHAVVHRRYCRGQVRLP